MTGATLLATLQSLQIEASYSRPETNWAQVGRS